MVTQHSFAHIKVILNGFSFSGWADEDPPYDIDQEESSDRTRGRDGGMYVLGLPMFGGMFTFKMMADSPTAQWSVQQEQFRKDAHHWLILHGRYVCKARKPECPTCVIADLCEFPDKTLEL